MSADVITDASEKTYVIPDDLSKDALPEWVKMPSLWIRNGRLTEFKWVDNKGSNNEAALITLLVMYHHMDLTNGVVKLTYDELSIKTNLSRTMLSNGIKILRDMDLIEKESIKRSNYKIKDYNSQEGWAKLPAKKMYFSQSVKGFGEFSKRKKIELDAIKLYFLLVSGRDNSQNICWMSYDTIKNKTGISRDGIKSAISLLCANGLILVENSRSDDGKYIKQGYRIIGIYNYHHMGTRGRSST